MIILNKITGRDVTTEYLGLLEGLITNEEFEVITMTPIKDEDIQVPCSAEQDWAWHYESE
jgi:hypothetical protein|tara:strand:+ start:788 stop:967 length:180 start_codon:yes stop_codon:yes gene_type:complete